MSNKTLPSGNTCGECEHYCIGIQYSRPVDDCSGFTPPKKPDTPCVSVPKTQADHKLRCTKHGLVLREGKCLACESEPEYCTCKRDEGAIVGSICTKCNRPINMQTFDGVMVLPKKEPKYCPHCGKELS